MFEILVVIFGLLQGITIAINKRCNWIFYIIQMIFMTIFSYSNHLYGDTLNSLSYIFLGIYSYISWGNPESKITELNNYQKIFIISIIYWGYFILRSYLEKTNDPLPQIDSFSTITSIVATILLIYPLCALFGISLFAANSGVDFDIMQLFAMYGAAFLCISLFIPALHTKPSKIGACSTKASSSSSLAISQIII